MAGRPPVPTALKLLRGTQKKCRINGAEPVSPLGAVCPPTASPEARALWKKYAPRYERMGCLKEADEIEFHQWMEILAEIEAARTAGEKVSSTLQDAAARKAIQFGGTPSARVRVKVEPKVPETTLGRFRGRA
jgi:phage terminase small subunit